MSNLLVMKLVENISICKNLIQQFKKSEKNIFFKTFSHIIQFLIGNRYYGSDKYSSKANNSKNLLDLFIFFIMIKFCFYLILLRILEF